MKPHICGIAIALAAAGPALAQHVHDRGYAAVLSGPAVFPPNQSPGVGTAHVIIDLVLFTMRVRAEFAGLTGTVTLARLHGGTMFPELGVADPLTPPLPAFPVGGPSGTYEQVVDLTLASSYDPAFIAASGGTISLASNALLTALREGRTYFSIETTAYGGGEIQGFLLPTPPADFDFNGVVDGADLLVWSAAFGVEHYGDATGDGLTDGADLLAWQRQLGLVAALAHGGNHAVATPEPTAASLLALGAALGAIARRRRPRGNPRHFCAKNGCVAEVARPRCEGLSRCRSSRVDPSWRCFASLGAAVGGSAI